MNLIQGITTDPLQSQTLILSDGSSFNLVIYFMPMQLAWVIQSLTYGTFTLQGYRIVNSPNLLNQYSNQLPFGLGCFSNGNRDPSLQQDFASGNSNLYLLSQDEVKSFQTYLSNGGSF